MTGVVPRIAVTGATGFIGRHLLRSLSDAGAEVRALTRRAPPDDSVTWVAGGLSDTGALARLIEGCDTVIHLAGVIKALSRDEFFRHNVEGTRALAEAIATSAPGAKLIHVSSLAAREPRLSDYAASKRAAELALRAYHGRIAMTVLRPPAVYGPGDLETLRLFKMAAAGWIMVPAVPGARLSLVHVADAVAAISAAVTAPATGPEPIEFDDGATEGHDWDAVAGAAMAAVRSEARVVRVPGPVLMAAGAIGSLLALVTRRPSVLSWAKAAEAIHPDWVARATGLPGYVPRWTVDKGFKDAVNWAISQGLLKSYS